MELITDSHNKMKTYKFKVNETGYTVKIESHEGNNISFRKRNG